MRTPKKFLTVTERSTYHRLEDVIGCKWSAGVVAAISEGVKRPGELERYIPGISKKILNERLRKLLAFDIISRTEIPGKIARVEYLLTPLGKQLARILVQIRNLNDTRLAEESDSHALRKS
ncbi:MAG TPA: helix-turn-helix domain-containing protein [Terrimicrobiaceae bacterium]